MGSEFTAPNKRFHLGAHRTVIIIQGLTRWSIDTDHCIVLCRYNCTLPPQNTSGYWPWNYTEVPTPLDGSLCLATHRTVGWQRDFFPVSVHSLFVLSFIVLNDNDSEMHYICIATH